MPLRLRPSTRRAHRERRKNRFRFRPHRTPRGRLQSGAFRRLRPAGRNDRPEFDHQLRVVQRDQLRDKSVQIFITAVWWMSEPQSGALRCRIRHRRHRRCANLRTHPTAKPRTRRQKRRVRLQANHIKWQFLGARRFRWNQRLHRRGHAGTTEKNYPHRLVHHHDRNSSRKHWPAN